MPANPHVGLIFLAPGRSDTLRVNGPTRLVRDASYSDAMAVQGRRPILAMEVTVDDEPLEAIERHYGPDHAENLYWTTG